MFSQHLVSMKNKNEMLFEKCQEVNREIKEKIIPLHKKKFIIKSNSCESIHKSQLPKIERKLCHKRTFIFTKEQIRQKEFSIYQVPNFLKNARYNIFDKKLQFLSIKDKLTLIMDNIILFKAEYMTSFKFKKAFNNLTDNLKASFNLVMEELMALLVKIPPILLENFFVDIDKILYCTVPDLTFYENVTITCEDDCLQKNLKIFLEVSEYFAGCTEVVKIIKSKITGEKFSKEKFVYLNTLLDVARFDASGLNCKARTYVEKYKNDYEFLSGVEEELKLREKKVKIISNDFNERQEKRDKSKKESWESMKNQRIVNALDLKKRFDEKTFLEKNKGKVNHLTQKSLLNSFELEQIMGNLIKSVRERIISQRVVERYKEKETSGFLFKKND